MFKDAFNFFVCTPDRCAVRLMDKAQLVENIQKAAIAREGPINIVNMGASVSRGTFVELCNYLEGEYSLPAGNKWKEGSCITDYGLTLWHMFVPGIYEKPAQTKQSYEALVCFPKP